MNLVYKHEKSLFLISAVISALIWLLLLVGTFGILLVYLLLGYVVFLFAHSAFIAYLKGTGVKITPEQYPDLHQALVQSCKRVGVTDVPDAYLLRTDFFNALATRFLGRHFIVLFTDVLDALTDRPQAVNFYIGHELGHIHRNHLGWKSFLFPAAILPLLGPALRRAEEYTCDRYGVACCDSAADVQAALGAIAAGDSRWQSMNTDAYLQQVAETRGFWMSFNELTGDYPWLTKRMATSLAMIERKDITLPRRHALAWLLALFVPRIGLGGGAGGLVLILMLVAILGIVAAIAIPQYQEYTKSAQYHQIYQQTWSMTAEVTAYMNEHQQWPYATTDLGYDSEPVINENPYYSVMLYDAGMIAVEVNTDVLGEGQYLIYTPDYSGDEIVWTCSSQNLAEKLLPENCR